MEKQSHLELPTYMGPNRFQNNLTNLYKSTIFFLILCINVISCSVSCNDDEPRFKTK